jgi:uncharacterized membrane protein YqjE
MESNASHRDQVVKPAGSDLLRGSIALVVSYLELRLRLLGLEFREAGLHLLVLIVFLLYLMMLILHWAWGWSALTIAGSLLFVSVLTGVIFTFWIAKPLFPMTFAELQKDRQWLERTTKSGR